ncbi:MAG: class I SAM-dependent methyltransferase [Candidatus Zixiibacteriota bacterium]
MADSNLAAYYRARAPEYEQVYYRDNPDRRRELADEARLLRDIVRGKEVLDLACGSGYWAEVMSETARLIVGVDLAREMLSEACRKRYRSPVQFVVGDLYRPPVKPEAFDIITLGFWFSHEPKQAYDRFLNQLRRLSRPGGQIWMIDNNLPAEGADREIVRTDEFGNTYKRRRLNNGQQYVILKNYFSEDQLREIFGGCFTINRVIYGQYYWSLLLTGVY